jgi:hypothetical protein
MSYRDKIIYYNENEIKAYETLLNITLKRKYDWFKKIKLRSLSYTEGLYGYMGMAGKIYVDKNWAEPNIIFTSVDPEYTYHFDDLYLTDDLINQFVSDFKNIFRAVFSIYPRNVSFSWLEVVMVEDDVKPINENTKKDFFIDQLKKRGAFKMTEYLGGYPNFMKIYGVEFWDHLTDDEIIENIKKFIEFHGSAEYNELEMEPIYLRENDVGVHQIEYFGESGVLVRVWGGYNYCTEEGEYRILYINLPRKILVEILGSMYDFWVGYWLLLDKL